MLTRTLTRTRSSTRPLARGAEVVRMHLAPVLGLRIKVLQGGDPTHMLSYQLEGDEASISLLNRLAAPGEDATTVLGTLAPMTPVTLSADAKVAAGIPAAAQRFAFAYPLADSLDADTEALLQMVIGSVSRLDDELFFFLLLGGFCYFDGDGGFLQANAISLKHDAAGELHFDGPYCCDSEAAEELSESGRMRPCTLSQLNAAGLVNFGWANPSERPGGHALHATVDNPSGAFLYERMDGTVVFYRTQRPATVKGRRPSSAIVVAVAAETTGESAAAPIGRGWAKGWAREHDGFERLQTDFEEALQESKRLRAAMARGRRGPVEQWLRTYGVVLVLYYTLGVALFHHFEGFSIPDGIYFMSVTATTVGYGDFSPVTWQGRLVSIFYMPFGTLVTLGGLLEPVGFCLSRLNKLNAVLIIYGLRLLEGVDERTHLWRVSATAGGAQQRASRLSRRGASGARRMAEGQKFTLARLCGDPINVGPTAAYVHALLQPVAVALVGCLVTHVVRSKSFIDSLYYFIVTMTTVRPCRGA